MKSFTEILEAQRYSAKSFEEVNYAADKAADEYAAKVYGEEAEKMKKNVPEIIDWCYLSWSRKEVKGFENLIKIGWNRMNTTIRSYPGSSSSYSNSSGLCFTVKMKFRVKKELSFKANIGDTPEYTFKVYLIFNTTGNKAHTWICDMEGKKIIETSDTISMDYIVEKIKKLDSREIHEYFYRDWVSAQTDHPLRGRYTGGKFGI